MKAWIIGSNGYIGKHLAYHLQKLGWDLDLCDVQSSSSINAGRYHCLDVRDKNAVKNLNWRGEYLFFMVGVTGTSAAFANYDLYIDVNEKGLLNILDALRASNPSIHIVFPSTRLVYKGVKGVPLREDAEKEFKTIYALNKWTGENLLKQYADYFDLQYSIVRICVPYGTLFQDGYSYGTVGFFLSKARNGEAIGLYGDGGQMRTFTHVEDICDQIVLLIAKKEALNNIFNIAGESSSLVSLAMLVANKFQVSVKFLPWPLLDEKLESGDTIFDGSKIEALVGIVNKHRLKTWIEGLE